LASSRVTGTDVHLRTAMVVWLRLDFASFALHTTVEMVHRDDVENVIKLIYETILVREQRNVFLF
jgi:putative aminopeptidase FrvX